MIATATSLQEQNTFCTDVAKDTDLEKMQGYILCISIIPSPLTFEFFPPAYLDAAAVRGGGGCKL